MSSKSALFLFGRIDPKQCSKTLSAFSMVGFLTYDYPSSEEEA
ncbi:hypothetical protein [Prochlorococcus sp. MIT 0604]|nr:hypothetical protein [Prochlorococcus sp. MIT 0604]AIQ95540.1 hypothetical protein EW14_1529 [Prochlorococcus sp. MIT 0604]